MLKGWLRRVRSKTGSIEYLGSKCLVQFVPFGFERKFSSGMACGLRCWAGNKRLILGDKIMLLIVANRR